MLPTIRLAEFLNTRLIKNLLFLVVSLFLSLNSSAVLASNTIKIIKTISPDAPRELLHWQNMIGNWSTTEESLKRDGSGWKKSTGAEWQFRWGLNGWAVQDTYISPPLSVKVEDPTKRQIGINIRTFDPEKKQWLMVWTTKDGKTVKLFSATSDGEKIVMLSNKAYDNGYMVRITFFDMNNNRFEWKYEMSKDGKTNWLEAYRIHGKRK